MRRGAPRLDLRPLAEGLRGPGLDTRTWLDMARVDDDPDAVVWDADLGWLADVTLSSGEGPINCRVASGAQGSGVGLMCPIRPGGLVIVAIPQGDPNVDAVIIGQLFDVDDANAPDTVNGDTIVETGASTGQVAADETHIAALAGEDIDIEARNVRVTGDAMVLGAAQANQPAVRGDDQADALGDVLDAIFLGFINLVTQIGVAGLPVNFIGEAAQLLDSINQFKAARADYLSSRITLD